MSNTPYSDPALARNYAEAAAKYQFQLPAMDLVAFLQIDKSERVLDIGSGTGAVASIATARVGHSGLLVALDSSSEMLRTQQQTFRLQRLVAAAPRFPVRSGIFDCATAGFVISHFPDYNEALREVRRILRPRGRFGATAWLAGKTVVSDIWSVTVGRFVDGEWLNKE